MIRTDPLGPVHPAEHLVEDFLKPLEMSEEQAAEALQLPIEVLRPFLQEDAPLTGDLALRLEQAFGCSADYWMRWQSGYELEVARDRGVPDLPRVQGLLAAE